GLADVWQNVAAVAAVYADEKPSESEDWHTHEESEIIERSVATDDPHALKFTEACIREYRLNHQPVYLAAAEDWASRLHQAKDWSTAERDAAGIEFRGEAGLFGSVGLALVSRTGGVLCSRRRPTYGRVAATMVGQKKPRHSWY